MGPREPSDGQLRTAASNKRVRVVFGGEVIADSPDGLYVWEWPYFPRYYLARADLRDGVLQPSTRPRSSESLGTATYYDVVAGRQRAEAAALAFLDSPVERLRDHVRFDFEAMDAWFEEDEEIIVHPRDPGARVQILPSSRHVTVSVDGILVADTHRPTFLYETHLPRRAYIPKLDVRLDLLAPSALSTRCPYKGTARYWSIRTPVGVRENLVWSYPTPLRESAGIAGLMAFYDEKVDVSVDGIALPRPATHFS